MERLRKILEADKKEEMPSHSIQDDMNAVDTAISTLEVNNFLLF
jgi:hypothetical protein